MQTIKEISALELKFIIDELKRCLIEAKLEQIYQSEKKEFVFVFHCPGIGKKILRVIIGKLMYLASQKTTMPERPPEFCLYLRKLLANARLREINQLGFNRIIEFLFERKIKDNITKYKVVIEFISPGNLIVCDKNNKILSVLETQRWKDRILRQGKTYDYPKMEYNFLEIDFEKFRLLLKKSKKQNLVKSLAIDLGLGGVFSEEICLLSKINKEKKPKEIDEKEIKKLFEEIGGLRKIKIDKTNAFVVCDKKEIINIIPFQLNFYDKFKLEKKTSFSKALDSVFTPQVIERKTEQAKKQIKSELDRIKDIIDMQKQRIEGLKVSEKENKRKGELMFENYKVINDILTQLKEARKTMSWEKIKEKLKGHKIIKNVDEKKGEIIIEVS